MIAVIKNTETGEVRRWPTGETWSATTEYGWTDGNYGCDCNRSVFFAQALDADLALADAEVAECGEGVYLVRLETDDGRELYADEGMETAGG